MSIVRSNLSTTLRLGLPASLVIIGILTIAGCIYIPVPEHPRTRDGRDAGDLIGPASSNKPIREGVATRDLVLRIMGKPDLRTAHGLAFEYGLSAVAGHRFGLCVADEPRMIRQQSVSTIFSSSNLIAGEN